MMSQQRIELVRARLRAKGPAQNADDAHRHSIFLRAFRDAIENSADNGMRIEAVRPGHEERAEAKLHVVQPLARGVLHILKSHLATGVGIREHGDRPAKLVEKGRQARLGFGHRDKRPERVEIGRGQRNAVLLRQIENRGEADVTVEVAMQVDFLHEQMCSESFLCKPLQVRETGIMATALLFDDVFKRHETEHGHPECPERIDSIREGLKSIEGLIPISPRKATLEEVELCHNRAYIEEVLRVIENGETSLANGDVSVCAESGEIALLAVGGVLNAVDAVLGGKPQMPSAQCARRGIMHGRRHRWDSVCSTPSPSQHVTLRRKHGLERVAIVDWDVHHGNGTQEIFTPIPQSCFSRRTSGRIIPEVGWLRNTEKVRDSARRSTTRSTPDRDGGRFFAHSRNHSFPRSTNFARS